MDVKQFRSLLVKVILGCVIIAAAVAVVAILVGSMGNTAWKAIWTLVVAVLHMAVLLGVLSSQEHSNPLLERSSNFAANWTTVILSLSLLTAVLTIWQVIDGELATKLFSTYVVGLVSVLHVKALMDIVIKYKKTAPYVYVNYLFIAIVAGMLLGLIYLSNRAELLDGFYGRALAASAVISVTLSVVAAVMSRLYLQSNPKVKAKFASQKTASSTLRTIVVLLVIFFVAIPVTGFMISQLSSMLR